MPDPMLFAGCLTVGAVAGVLGGMLGIGGGVVIVPSLLVLFEGLGMTTETGLRVAVATSLASIVATSASAARAQHRRGAVEWPLVLRMAPWLVAGSVVCAPAVELLPARILGLLVGAFFAAVAVVMLSNWSPAPAGRDPRGSTVATVGLGAGAISSAAGIGGGNVLVPTFVWFGIEMPRATGTSSALGVPIALAGTIGWILASRDAPELPPFTVGYVLWPAAIAIAATSVLTAPLGVALAHRVPRLALRRTFGILLLLVSARLVLRALA